MRTPTLVQAASAALLLGVLPFVAGHGDGGMDTDVEGPNVTSIDPDSPTGIAHRLPSYFRHPHYAGWNLAHLVLMVLAWFVMMPLAIMLSGARSRWHLPAQVVFHIFNGLGLFAGFVYNHSTPDLYENNAHHPLGWVVTAFTIAWTIMSFYTAYGEYRSSRRASLEHGWQITAQNMAEYHRVNQYNDSVSPRDSRDSGQGTERNSASLFGSRQNSSESILRKPEESEGDFEDDVEEKNTDTERRGFLGNNRVDRFISRGVKRFSTQRASTVVRVLQVFLEKVLLLLGFAALTTGFVVSGGIFRDRQIFSGLAHYIKGGIFVWYGLLTLGRWMGAFTEFGWGWNIRPNYPLVAKWKSRIPSAEYTESFVIWLYGASNVFLEHLNNWGDQWTASDLEHLSITLLFFGGGLVGMLIESSWVRNLMNTTVVLQKSKEEEHGAGAGAGAGASRSAAGPALEEPAVRWEQPKTYRIPLNPMPALTIMLLGMMMGSHHQKSMVSTMMHAQWGGLFTAFALARGATYITLYLKPPTSHFPSRPPSEIVAAFCLIAGGILFMNSAADVVWAIESNGLDAMTIFTVTMGLTGVIMAWEIVTFAIKGWAVRKERAAAGKSLP